MEKRKIVLAILCVGFMIASGLAAVGSLSVAPEQAAPEPPLKAFPLYNVWPTTFPNANVIEMWMTKNQSDPGFPYPYENPPTASAPEFFGTNHFVDGTYTFLEMNNASMFPLNTTFIVGAYTTNASMEDLADQAKLNPRIVGALLDDFAVGQQSPANMSGAYVHLHHEDANLTQGPLKLWLVVYNTNFFVQDPYTWASIEPYFDGIQFWFFGGKYGLEGSGIAAYEQGARWLHSELPDKLMKGGYYMHYYNAGDYGYDIMSDLLKIDARLTTEGIMQGITVISNFWLANSPTQAYFLRNFVVNELNVAWASTWNWATNAVTTTRNGAAGQAPAITEISTKWTGNKTFVSTHHQTVSVTGFSGLNLTVKDMRTTELINTSKIGSTWQFIASPGETYKIYNWPHADVLYDSNQTISSATAWSNKDIVFLNSSLIVNSTLWLNNSRIRFDNMTIPSPLWVGAAADNGIFLPAYDSPKIYFNNATIDSYNRYFPYQFSISTTGTAKVIDIRNSSIACAGSTIRVMGTFFMSDSQIYQPAPNGAAMYALQAYTPGYMNSITFVRNDIWASSGGSHVASTAIFMPGNFNDTASWIFSDNHFYGGYSAGFTGEELFASNTSFDNTLISKTNALPGLSWVPYAGGDPSAKLLWVKVKVSIKTDFAITGTLKNATGGTIGTYSSSGSFLNASNVPWAYYSEPDTVYVRNPFPWTFTITSALPTGYYVMLGDTSTMNLNKTAWIYPGYLPLNGTSFQIWHEQTVSLHLYKVAKNLWTGITNYVNATGTLSISDKVLYWSRNNWTTPHNATGFAATTNKGTLSLWGISYNPGASSLVASWSANHNQTGGTMVMSFSGLLPNQKYSIFRELTLMAYVKTDGAGRVTYTYAGTWSSHSFSMNVYNEGSGQTSVNAAFTFTANGLKVKFQDASQGHGIYKWLWDFGDKSSTSTSQDPSHTFAKAGSYRVTLTVMNADGISDTITKTVTVSGIASGADLFSVVTMMAFGLMFAGALIAIAIRRPAAIIVGVLGFLFGILLLFSGL